MTRRLLAQALAVPIGPARVTDAGGDRAQRSANALPGLGDDASTRCEASQPRSRNARPPSPDAAPCGAEAPLVLDELPPAPRPTTTAPRSFAAVFKEPEPVSTVAMKVRLAPPRVEVDRPLPSAGVPAHRKDHHMNPFK